MVVYRYAGSFFQPNGIGWPIFHVPWQKPSLIASAALSTRSICSMRSPMRPHAAIRAASALGGVATAPASATATPAPAATALAATARKSGGGWPRSRHRLHVDRPWRSAQTRAVYQFIGQLHREISGAGAGRANQQCLRIHAGGGSRAVFWPPRAPVSRIDQPPGFLEQALILQ